MPNKDSDYKWLDEIEGPLPRMIVEARKLLGTKEIMGSKSNPVIMDWAKDLGGSVEASYKADDIPWCGLFMAVVAKRAGKTPPVGPLWALNWAKFGEPGGQPDLGDVVVLVRKGGGGHVALYVGEDATHFHLLGGNQSNRVCYDRFPKERLVAIRQPPYMNKPASAAPYLLSGYKGESKTEG